MSIWHQSTSEFLHDLLEFLGCFAIGGSYHRSPEYGQHFLSEVVDEFGILHSLLQEVQAEYQDALVFGISDDVENSLHNLIGNEILEICVAMPQQVR